MYGYIYMTINIFNGKRYIGQHKSKYFDLFYKGSGFLIRQAFEKYGFDNFAIELLDTAESFEELNQKEYYWIEYYNAVDSDEFYNLMSGGNKPEFSSQTIKKMRNSHLGSLNSMYGRFGKDNPLYGRKHSDHTRRLMSENHADFSGENNPMYGINRKGDLNPFYGHKHSQETIQKMIENHKGMTGIHHTNDTKKKLSDNIKGRRWINNGLVSKRVKDSELDLYLQGGWNLGRLRRTI